MVAKFSHGSSLYGALSYNQEKVNEGLGKVLATNLVIEPNDGMFNVASCMEDFERFMPSHIRTSKPVIHISLNPHPDDKLTDQQLAPIDVSIYLFVFFTSLVGFEIEKVVPTIVSTTI